MTEETRESYDSGEIVWVKLGSSWWPGEVKNADELPSEVVDFKKAPLVIVKFFDEDSYEYVKTWVSIYPYNCEKKNEFIKKGMAAFRAKLPHMEKFPKDVLKAEEKLGGNLNILSDPMFLPEKKRNYAAEVFGTPSPKTTPKNKRRYNTSKSGSKKDTSHITHRRFLGTDDYRAFICIQYPGKDRIPGDREDEEVLRINREPEQDFNCHSCSFSTKRLEVMILHTKSHIKGVYLSSAWKNKQSASRRRKEKSKKKKKDSEAADSDSSSDGSEPLRQKKRKPRAQGVKKKKAKTEEEVKEPPKKDIRSELLEAWEDSDEDEDLDISFEKMDDSKSMVDSLNKTADGSSSETALEDSAKKSDALMDTLDKIDFLDPTDSTQSEVVDESLVEPEREKTKSPPQTIEEALNDVTGEPESLNAQSEPVKPVVEEHLSTEKLLSTLEDDSMDDDDKIDEEKKDDKEVTSDKKSDTVEEAASKSDTEDSSSKKAMDKDMHEAIKSCFDFDEDEEEDTSTIVSKAASGRKIPRVIPKKSTKKLPGEPSAESASGKEKGEEEDIDTAFKELMEMTSVPDLPEVQNNLKCEQNFHNIKTIKFPDKPEQVGSPPKLERKDSTEVATKLTNPKKRFVKSFEDFELMQNEIRRREEEQLETPKSDILEETVDPPRTEVSCVGEYDYLDKSEEQYSPESTIELSKLKSKIMSKIIEEAKINVESKNKIMAKIQEVKPRVVESEPKPVTAQTSSISHSKEKIEISTSHRTPRSKILESYRKDTNKYKENKTEPIQPQVSTKESSSSKVEDRLKEERKERDVVPPVRKKWSRRGSHPKKDKNVFRMQEISPEVPSSTDLPKDILEEPTKTEEQTYIEPEPVSDTSKINNITLEEQKPLDDVLTNEVIEEEAVEPAVKESSSTQLQSTEPVSLEGKDENIPEELPSKDEVKADDKLLPAEPNVTQSEEFSEENKLLIDEGTNVVKDISELIEEKNVGFVEEVPRTVLETEVVPTVLETEVASTVLETEVAPTVHEREVTPTVRETEVPPTLLETEIAPTVSETEIAPTVFETEIASTVSETEIAPTVSETEIAPIVSETEIAPTLSETEIAPIVSETEIAPTISETEVPPTVLETEVAPTVEMEVPPTILETEIPPTVLETGVAPTVEMEVPPTILETEIPPTVLETGVAPTVETEVPPTILETEVPPTILETEIPPTILEIESPPNEPREEEKPEKEEEQATEEKEKGISEEFAENKDISLSNIEDSTTVPLKKTEESTLETVESAEKHIESAPLLVTESLASLPKDVIASPPKKSKKRKFSDRDFVLSPTKAGAVAELNFDNFVPLEKKKKDEDLTEEDKNVSLPFVKNLKSDDAEKNESEITLKVLHDTEVPESGVFDEKTVEETQEGEIDKDKDNQEPSVDIKKNVDEVVEKFDNQEPVDNEESDSLSKDSEEKEETMETDSKTLEPEVAMEQPKDTECNKESDLSDKEHINEVEIQCASSSLDSFKFSIQTNLSILSSREEMSALALATLSEIKADLESNEDIVPKEHPKRERSVVPPVLLESEMMHIEGNLTVVSEKDLADGQVEITSEQVISPKRPVTLSSFSMDFSDSLSDSNSNSTTDTSSDISKCDFNSKGTEFTPKALTKQMKKVDQKKESTYGRLELINILEGNSDTEKKPKDYTQLLQKSNTVEDIFDFEEHIPSQIVCAKNLKTVPMDLEPDYKEFKEKGKGSKTSVKSTTSKLLERLTTESKAKASATKIGTHSDTPVSEAVVKAPPKSQIIHSSTPKSTRHGKHKSGSSSSKPIILSEQIVKPATEPPKSKPKKPMEDIEDVEAPFVIRKDQSKMIYEEEETAKLKSVGTKTSGKAKILQQTIITPAGEIIQPTVAEAQVDDNIFDINSMPIVLSDEILTPESIEKMPIVIGSDTVPKVTVPEKVVKRPGRIITTVTTPQVPPNKTITITKHTKQTPRILQSSFGNKVLKNSPLLPNTAKPGKYIIVPQSSIPPAKYVPKKQTVVKKTSVTTGIVQQKVANIAPEPSGNKIMIVTNQQGQQQRLLLTPAQQKMIGYQNQKVTKTIVKGNVMQKSVLTTKTVPLVEAGTSGVVSKTPSLIGQKVLLGTSSSQGLITTTGHQIIGPQGRITKSVSKRSPAQKLTSSVGKPQKTILIKNQHGQTVRKIQGTDDELLDKQVAEQLEAIKASSGMKFASPQKPAEAGKATPKMPVRRFYSKRAEPKSRGPPPLAGLHQPPKPETIVAMPALKKPEPIETKQTPVSEETPKAQQAERPLNQLVIQDAVGNQTTITEGQILALPSETVDGQPQSYMLVTLDESGNLTPLNSEALMSLDPNLGLGGDLSNMVLQIDQSALSERPQPAVIKSPEVAEPVKAVEVEPAPQPVPEPSVTTEVSETVVEQQKVVPATEALPASTNGDPGQQLIVTGDPIATQKFLESLTEGTTDLANILANAEGNSILIQADGQQILINTNTDNQMLLSMNNDNVNVAENTEGGGNPIFATQPSKNQDILAAALADTDVFQQDHPSGAATSKIGSQLSPNNALYPMNVGNVLETSLTLSSPIMTPLEVPSTNSKKIPDDEADILTQVPKNVDLPITITDPNISQTVANQQVSAMIANELQTNLELSLPISETTISTVSTEMNSPSYVYSLPTLDDSVEISQKPFNGSMPLLNEDVEETMNKAKAAAKAGREKSSKGKSDSFMAVEEGRFTLGGEMCSSLSEPPPEMFDLPEVNQAFGEKSASNIPSLQSTPDVSDNASKDDDTTDLSHADTSSEGSCEIPLQPQIVAKSLDLSRNLDSLKRSLSEAAEGESKKCKFD